jgi:hypothetical protein
MCNPTNPPRSTNTLMLTSLQSFGEDAKGQAPSTSAKLFTIGAFIVFLCMMEQLCRLILVQYSVCLTTTLPAAACMYRNMEKAFINSSHTCYTYLSLSLFASYVLGLSSAAGR